MLWWKEWHKSRWLFCIFLTLCCALTVGSALGRRALLKLLSIAVAQQGGLDAARRVQSMYVDVNAYVASIYGSMANNLGSLLALAAIFFGLGGLAVESKHGSALFTLSKPVSRFRILLTKFVVDTIQMAVIVLSATLVIYPALRAAGDYYPLHKLFPYALAAFLAALVPYAFTFFMAHVLADNIRAGASGAVLLFCLIFTSAIKRVADYNPLSHLSGVWIFVHGRFPWAAALLAVLIVVVFFYGSWRVIEKRDF